MFLLSKECCVVSVIPVWVHNQGHVAAKRLLWKAFQLHDFSVVITLFVTEFLAAQCTHKSGEKAKIIHLTSEQNEQFLTKLIKYKVILI